MPTQTDLNSQLILALGRVEGKIDSFSQAQLRHEARLDGHEARLNILERWQAKIIALGAAAGAGVSAIWQYLQGAMH